MKKWRSICSGWLLLVCTACGKPAMESAPAGKTEILWDTWGVPHIFATSDEQLFEAFGWAQMTNHGNLVLRLYGQARGRAAEYWGRDFLESDRLMHRMGVPARADRWLAEQEPEFRTYLEAFVRGVNAYARVHGDLLDDDVKAVLPVTPQDTLAHLQRVIYIMFVGAETMDPAARWESRGSNAWAIAPTHSESGHAMLVANPHLPWSGFFTWFEAQLSAPGLDAYGATLVGNPFLGIAFNDHLGWTHTNNTMDGADLYEVTSVPGGYLFDGETRAFESETVQLKVKEENGNLETEELTVLRSVHGPIIAEKAGKMLATRLVGLDQPHMLKQYWDMIHAHDLAQFESAYKRLQNPYFNLIYADRDGHILYLFGGRTPKRASGGWQDWQGVAPGDGAANLWTETHPYEDLPRVVDPPNGWVQNANDPPWSSTWPQMLAAGDYPAYMAPRGMAFRPQRSVRMLCEDDKISFDELLTYKMSTRSELADRLLDDLIPPAKAVADSPAAKAAAILESWDRCFDKDSRGAVLFAEWARNLGAADFARPWREDEPLTTPDGLKDPAAAVEKLAGAAARVSERYGAADVAWGDVYRLRMDSTDLPANGGPSSLGIFRVVYYQPGENHRYHAFGGDSYVATIEFGEQVVARALISGGNASQPGSPHRTDQLALFSEKKLRPVWRQRAEVEANLEKRETIPAH